ncbi:uncharacterized protein PRCAT00006268001 [Priceomyces carsonii]|uniref:uncharacterized protein n=1 Tax=Priceomyces carsonii TaxID=28549 RepID=UPI002ED7F306|nr:unnamed protein product [Priceomyces carsonii]
MATEEDITISLDNFIKAFARDTYKIAEELHKNPEVAFEEHYAHDYISNYFESLGEFKVTKHAYGVDTAFEVLYENGGRLVNFNAELDALPDIGHGCGHNLIAACSCAAFLGLVETLKKYNLPGSVQLLGTPAEESLGGKCFLVNAGAYNNVAASLMAHPLVRENNKKVIQVATDFLACSLFETEFTGAAAHASAFPWNGVNALDACVGSWVNVSMLRQQIKPYERIHGYFKDGPKVANVIPHKAKVVFQCRSKTKAELFELKKRVESCCNAGAMATGCSSQMNDVFTYADLVHVPSLDEACYESSKVFCSDDIELLKPDEVISDIVASSDVGTVSYEVPVIHMTYTMPTIAKCPQHSALFAQSAGILEKSMPPTLLSAKILALTAYKILSNDELYLSIKSQHENIK